MSFNGYNNKLANVPTITGLSDIVADSVNTDTLIVDGNDVSVIIDQVPINTANIATLQQITTGQSYATLGDVTTFDNNVTLTTGKTMTADNFTGLASNATRIEIAATTSATTFFPVFSATGAGQKELRFNISGNPLSYVPSTNTLTATTFAGNATTATTATNATNATNVALFVDNTAGTYWIPFSKTTSTTSNALFIDTTTTPLSYNPDTSTLTATNFSGLASTATIASTASQVLVTVNDDATTYYPIFASSGTGQKSLLFDTTTTPLSYFPSTSTLSATNFTAGTNVTTPNILSLSSITPSNGSSISLNGTPVGNGGNINTVCMGVNAGNATMPNNNFCFGTNAGRNLSTAGGFQSGVQNLCIGANSGSSLTFGKYNCYLGASAARFTTTGTNNTQIGAQTQTFPDNNLIGSYNTTIGSECHISVDGLSYSTAIGAGVAASTSNTVRIGRSADNTIFDGTVTFNNNLLLTSPATTLTPTELSYLDGATSNIQAQLNAINPANFVTLAGTQTITGVKSISTGLSLSASCMDWLDTVTNNRLSFRLNAGVGAFNNLTEAGDSMILCSNTGSDIGGNLTICPWSSTLSGVRINRLKTFIGVGTTVKTAAVECEGSNVTITGTLTLNNNLILTTPSTTLTQTELSYLDGATSNIQAQINAFPAAANTVTTNTVQNITANKTFFGSSLLIDDGSGENCTVSQTNQITHMKSNIVQNTITATALVPSQALNTIVITDGTNPNIVVNQIITGGNQPLLPDWIVSSVNNYTTNITTLGMTVGQVQLASAAPIGTFFTSGIGTNFAAGTYLTALVVPASSIYSISINALNTTLNKVSHTLKNITTNITKAAAIGNSTFTFTYEGTIRMYSKTSGGVDQVMMSVSNTNSIINAFTVLGTSIHQGVSWFNNNFLISTNALGTAPTLRLTTFGPDTYIQAGLTNTAGTTADIIFSSIYSATRWATMNILGLTMNATCMYGRDDQFDFVTVPAGALNQPIGFTTTYSETAVTFTNNTQFVYSNLPLLDNGVWTISVFLNLTRGTGTFNNNSTMRLSVVNSGTTNYYPDSCTSQMPLPSGHTDTNYSICMTYTYIVKSTVPERTAPAGFINMASLGTATKRLKAVMTKIA